MGGPTGLSRFLQEVPAELMMVEQRPRYGGGSRGYAGGESFGGGGYGARPAAGPRYEATEDAAPRRAPFRPAGYSGGGPPAGAKGAGAGPAQRTSMRGTSTRGTPTRGTPGRGGSEPAPRGPRLSLGKIIHPTFGHHAVIAQDGTGPEARLTVLFPGGITKKIVARYAQWEESDVDF